MGMAVAFWFVAFCLLLMNIWLAGGIQPVHMVFGQPSITGGFFDGREIFSCVIVTLL